MNFFKEIIKLYSDYRDYQNALRAHNDQHLHYTSSSGTAAYLNKAHITKHEIENGLSNLVPHRTKKKLSFLTKLRRLMKNLFKKLFNIKSKSKSKSRSKSKRKSAKRTSNNKGRKIMAIVKIELSDDVKQVAAKLRELADKLDPIESTETEVIAPKKKAVESKPVVKADVKKKTVVAKEDEETFEDESEFTESGDIEESDEETYEDEEIEPSLSIESDIIPACKAFTKKNGEKGRAKIAEILKSFKAKSVHDLKELDYEKFLKKIK